MKNSWCAYGIICVKMIPMRYWVSQEAPHKRKLGALIVNRLSAIIRIGLRMSELIVTLSGGHLPIALVLTALGSIVLGMGLPTTAAYVVLAADPCGPGTVTSNDSNRTGAFTFALAP